MPVILTIGHPALSAPMKLADLKTKAIGGARYLWLATKAMGLNMSVLYLVTRLWRVNWALNGFLHSIEDAKKRAQVACQDDAQLAFERILGSIPISSLGLQPVIVQALEWDDVHTLRGLGDRLHSLESIPNIGPMRARTIEKAYQRRLEKAALQSCHTIVMIGEIRNYFGFRDSVMVTKGYLAGQIERLKLRADDYYAEIDTYCGDAEYRLKTSLIKDTLWNDAEACFDVVREALARAESGQANVNLMSMNDRKFQSMAAEELSEITFKLSYGFFNQIKVKAGQIISS